MDGYAISCFIKLSRIVSQVFMWVDKLKYVNPNKYRGQLHFLLFKIW
jgi:hypothetical protein